jgi:hypothetical protein
LKSPRFRYNQSRQPIDQHCTLLICLLLRNIPAAAWLVTKPFAQKETRMAHPQNNETVTRGHGLLEPLLARLRTRMAEKLIPEALRKGRILDIGCGSYPYFLSHTSFKEKFAIDQLPPSDEVQGIAWHTLDLNAKPSIPFPDDYFNVVTMLAVVEHLDPNSLISLFTET